MSQAASKSSPPVPSTVLRAAEIGLTAASAFLVAWGIFLGLVVLYFLIGGVAVSLLR